MGILATPVDDSQQFILDVDFSADLTLTPAVATSTAALPYFHRTSLVMPTPTLDERGRPQDPWDPTDTIRAPWGRLQLVTNGQDVTTLRGVPFQPISQSDADPFGDETLVVQFAQFSTFEHPGSGDLAWLAKGRNIELKRVRPDGSRVVLWTGQVQRISGHGNESGDTIKVTCRGALFGPDYGVRAPSFDYRERDRGYVIAEAFNLYGGASHGKCIPVVTGITTRKRGSWEKLVTGYVLDLLSEMTTDDGLSQWTVKQNHRTPVIALRDTSTIHATLTNGVDGLTVDLDNDLTSGCNVIYGEGIAPNGMRWGNTKHPRLRPGALPTFPGTTFTPGSGTTGFQPLSDELRLNGYPHLLSQNTYLTADEDEIKDAQRRAGVPADGTVDATTWTGIFALGSNRGDLLGSYRAPLASDTRVERYLYNAQGGKIGNNPDFDPTIPRIERFINFGEGTTLTEGKRLARAILARDAEVGHFGTVTLDGIDPEEMSRLDLRSGMNLKLKGYLGIDRTLHIAHREISWDQPKVPVTLSVDTKGRDRLTLDAIRARNAAAATDPVLRQTPQKKSSRQNYDNRIMWDDDAGAGRTYPFACTGGQWTVAPPVPASQRGDIVRTHAVTSSSATRYALMVFGKRVTPAMIAARLPNPLAVADWTDFSDALVDLGILNGWGTQDNACGYGNHYQGQAGATVNGVFDDSGQWSFESFQPPWLWVAVFPIATCTANVHLYAAAET